MQSQHENGVGAGGLGYGPSLGDAREPGEVALPSGQGREVDERGGLG
jgi:hypothetical protein